MSALKCPRDTKIECGHLGVFSAPLAMATHSQPSSLDPFSTITSLYLLLF